MKTLVTRYDSQVIVQSDADSHNGITLVTLTIEGNDYLLFPNEARKIAALLHDAAGKASMT